MPNNDSGLKGYMPTRRASLKRITDLLGGDNKWDVTHKDILGKEFIVHSIAPTQHASKPAAIGTIELDDKRVVCLFASKVLSSQLLKFKDELPVLCKIAKSGKRYRFTI